MKHVVIRSCILSLGVAVAIAGTACSDRAKVDTAAAEKPHADQSHFDSLAQLPFELNRPTPSTAAALADELKFQQATQAYLWALPLINTLGMKYGSEATFGAGYNILPIWKERLDTK